MIRDLSPPSSARLAVWQGDTPPSRVVRLDLARRATLTLATRPRRRAFRPTAASWRE